MIINTRNLVACFIVSAAGVVNAQNISVDFIDDILSPGSGAFEMVPGSFDFVDNVNGVLGSDGIPDIAVKAAVATGNVADDGNNVDWTDMTLDVSGTGLRSTIDPAFINSGGVTMNNGGHVACQQVTINFLAGISVLSEFADGTAGIKNFGWSSGNTAGVVWEHSILEYLDASGMPFSATPTIGSYGTHAPIDGMAGTGTWVADGLGVVTSVGMDLAVAGANGANNSLATSSGITVSGIPVGTELGGVRMTHCVEDVRGTSNGDTSFTNTINELNLNLKGVPEPASGSMLLLGAIGLMGIVRRR